MNPTGYWRKTKRKVMPNWMSVTYSTQATCSEARLANEK
jgi:hypothetical protein